MTAAINGQSDSVGDKGGQTFIKVEAKCPRCNSMAVRRYYLYDIVVKMFELESRLELVEEFIGKSLREKRG